MNEIDTKPNEPDETPFLEEQPITLSPVDQQAFFEALLNPPGPNEALKKLMSSADDGASR